MFGQLGPVAKQSSFFSKCLLIPGEDSTHRLEMETIQFLATLETVVLTSSF